MKYMYHVETFTFDNDAPRDEWSSDRSTPQRPHASQTLESWLEAVTNGWEGAEVISITETGDRLTAIVRTEDHEGDDDDEG